MNFKVAIRSDEDVVNAADDRPLIAIEIREY